MYLDMDGKHVQTSPQCGSLHSIPHEKQQRIDTTIHSNTQ